MTRQSRAVRDHVARRDVLRGVLIVQVETGQIIAGRLVPLEFAFLDQLGHRVRGEGLGGAANREHGLCRDRFLAGHVRVTVTLREHDLPVAHDADSHSRHEQTLHGLFDFRVEAGKGIAAGRLRGCVARQREGRGGTALSERAFDPAAIGRERAREGRITRHVGNREDDPVTLDFDRRETLIPRALLRNRDVTRPRTRRQHQVDIDGDFHLRQLDRAGPVAAGVLLREDWRGRQQTNQEQSTHGHTCAELLITFTPSSSRVTSSSLV